MTEQFDVAILGGGLIGAACALTLRKRGARVVVLEARPAGKEQKIVVGEAVTEGTSLYLRHELGLEPWFAENAYRKFGFDFVTQPEGETPRRFEDCHELMLSQAPLERIRRAYAQLIPTYHVERPPLNEHVAALARQAGADFRAGAAVERVDLGEGEAPHVVRYAAAGEPMALAARWVIDCSGRKCVLGRQLGIHQPVAEPSTAAVWNRFDGVPTDPSLWRGYHGIDRRRHTIHFTGRGFWIWWIHQADDCTSVGITWDKAQHQPNVKAADHGFAEMVGKFPLVLDLLKNAKAKEPYQYLAHLPYKSEHWISARRYALLGDAAWFTDALYSVGLEAACRQQVFLTRILVDDLAGKPIDRAAIDQLNDEFQFTCRTVAHLNQWKYRHGWHNPWLVAQTVLYETAEIGPLYQMQRASNWNWQNQSRYYRLQWGSAERERRLRRFLDGSLADAARAPRPLLRKGLLPGRAVYAATWPLWNVPGMHHYFFRLIRAWGYWERMAQRHAWWPDVLERMARGLFSVGAAAPVDEEQPAAAQTGT